MGYTNKLGQKNEDEPKPVPNPFKSSNACRALTPAAFIVAMPPIPATRIQGLTLQPVATIVVHAVAIDRRNIETRSKVTAHMPIVIAIKVPFEMPDLNSIAMRHASMTARLKCIGRRSSEPRQANACGNSQHCKIGLTHPCLSFDRAKCEITPAYQWCTTRRGDLTNETAARRKFRRAIRYRRKYFLIVQTMCCRDECLFIFGKCGD
jgi:hypothetical protein